MTAMQRALRIVSIAAAALLLAGCENDTASWTVGGSTDNALTLIREQRWVWQRSSEVSLVVAHHPDCQRRHSLNPRPVGDAKAELYSSGQQLYVLKNGELWYAIDQRSCEVFFTDPPAAADRGPLVGSFDYREGRLRFVAEPAPAAER